MKIALIFGTRPEAIKMAPIYHELQKNKIDTCVIVTGQHKEMLFPILDVFNIKVDYNLNIIRKNQNLSELTGKIILELEQIIKNQKFDCILVQGDTTSVLCGALVGFYNRIPIAHIEAGLRTGNLYSPFPEEVNRKIVSVLSSLHFAPTQINVNNLLQENCSKNSIYLVGNTVIDALFWIKTEKRKELSIIREKYDLSNKKYILLTMHRRENLGEPLKQTLKAIKDYLSMKNDLYLVFPMHLNPLVRESVHSILKDFEKKILLDPLNYLEFIAVMEGAHYIMTDSGGIQEEGPSLGKPILILRDTTERPEGIEAGTARLVGTDYHQIIETMHLLEGDLYDDMAQAKNPYGDGTSAQKIIREVISYVNKNS